MIVAVEWTDSYPTSSIAVNLEKKNSSHIILKENWIVLPSLAVEWEVLSSLVGEWVVLSSLALEW